MRVRAVIAYDGTGYSGFQRQANALSVQAALESAMQAVTQECTSVLAAGRTDAGVHAEGQVIAFDTAWRHPTGALRRALNAVLPADVAVLELEEAESDYHPRYDAISRWYRYTVCNTVVRRPLGRLYSLHVPRPLDMTLMLQAAECLVGEHNFAAFGRSPSGSSTVRRVYRATWTVDGPWLLFDIEANAFLHRMVRSIVGTLLEVGYGTMDVGEFAAVLASRDRGRAGPTAPPQGLCLMGVTY